MNTEYPSASSTTTPDIFFQIVSTDIVNDSILVRPWSTKYANPISSYPHYNVSISNLDLSQDLNIQIARFCTNIVTATLLRESSAVNIITDYLSNNNNNMVYVPASAVAVQGQVTYSPITTGTNINFIA